MPETEYKNEVVEMSQASEEAFIKQWVGEDVPMNELYIAYKDWCMENSMAFAPTSASFGKNLMGYASYVVKKRTNKGMVFSKLV
jgi:phage/plasmid-associated DNA primase